MAQREHAFKRHELDRCGDKPALIAGLLAGFCDRRMPRVSCVVGIAKQTGFVMGGTDIRHIAYDRLELEAKETDAGA